jgi:hypothetical protein
LCCPSTVSHFSVASYDSWHPQRGICAKEEIEFYTSSYGLGATVNCSVKPLLDHSLNDDIWTLQEIVLKTPGEHSIWNYETGQEETFVGELQLAYKGSRDEFETGLEGHAENIAIVGVMLKVEEGAEDNEELEKLIRGWERHQEERYETCDVEYDDDECTLSTRGRNDNSDNLDTSDEDNTTDGEECQEDCSKCCRATDRKLGSADNMLSEFSTLRGHDNLAETVKKQKEEIEQLKEQLQRCEITTSTQEITPEQHDRELGYWNRKCGDSYYCLMNLFKNTETDVSGSRSRFSCICPSFVIRHIFSHPSSRLLILLSQYYYNYRGGLTYPPCTEIVYWRVMVNPLIISPGQLERIERLTFMHLNDDCKLDTVGRRRNSSGSCAVDVNRPRQALSQKHGLKRCDAWNTAGAFADFSAEDDEEEVASQWNTGGSTWARASSVFVNIEEEDEGTKKKSKRSQRRR